MAQSQQFKRRAARTRYQLKKKGGDRVIRLSVHRSAKHIYAQVIDDTKGVTLASASSMEKEAGLKGGSNVAAAEVVGKLLAERAKKAKVDTVKFDRGGYVYHGRVKALAEAARQAGLKF